MSEIVVLTTSSPLGRCHDTLKSSIVGSIVGLVTVVVLVNVFVLFVRRNLTGKLQRITTTTPVTRTEVCGAVSDGGGCGPRRYGRDAKSSAPALLASPKGKYENNSRLVSA